MAKNLGIFLQGSKILGKPGGKAGAKPKVEEPEMEDDMAEEESEGGDIRTKIQEARDHMDALTSVLDEIESYLDNEEGQEDSYE